MLSLGTLVALHRGILRQPFLNDLLHIFWQWLGLLIFGKIWEAIFVRSPICCWVNLSGHFVKKSSLLLGREGRPFCGVLADCCWEESGDHFDVVYFLLTLHIHVPPFLAMVGKKGRGGPKCKGSAPKGHWKSDQKRLAGSCWFSLSRKTAYQGFWGFSEI